MFSWKEISAAILALLLWILMLANWIGYELRGIGLL